MKKYSIMLSTDIALIVISNLIISWSNLLDYEIPGFVIIIICIAVIAAIPLIIWAGVMKKFGRGN